MKIGLIIYGTLDTLSGGFLYDRMLVAHLRASGCQVDILSLPWRDYATHLGDNLRLGWARQIAAARYDVLLQDELNHPSLFLLNMLLRRISASPIISIIHHLRSSEDHPPHLLPLYRLIERLYLQTVDGFIYNSRTTCQIVQGLLGRAKPHVVAYPAADHRKPPTRQAILNAIRSRMHANQPLQLLLVGNLMARKGLHTVLNALARLDTKRWHLHIVGSEAVDPSYSTAMRHRADTLSLTPNLTWHGRISDDALHRLLSGSDLLVMPSYEGFGIVFLEGMAFGLPVLAANIGAAGEIIYPGINGYLVPFDDDLALAQYLTLLEENRVHLATLAYHARHRYDQHPTWAESMDTAYHWLHEGSY
jgi:glycosyltransferase involved in cell wall biosynthesis